MHAQVNVDTRRRNGSRYAEVELRDDDGEFIAFVSFEQIDARWGDLYTALVWFNDRDSQRFPFDPKQVDDRLMKRLGIRKWMVFEPAMKLAFGKTRSNPSRGRRGQVAGSSRAARSARLRAR